MINRAKIIGVSIAVLICCGFYFLSIKVMRPSAQMYAFDEGDEFAQSAPKGEMEFRLIAAGQGDLGGIDASFQSYSCSDGVSVLFLTQILSSAALAQEELERRTMKAIRIIEKGIKIDRDGTVVGERAVILFQDRTNSEKEMVAVFWTRKMDLLAIETQSMKHALAFEKKYCR